MENIKPADTNHTKIQQHHTSFNGILVMILGIFLLTIMGIYIYDNFFEVVQPQVEITKKVEPIIDEKEVELQEKGVRIDSLESTKGDNPTLKVAGEALDWKFSQEYVSGIIMDTNGNTLGSVRVQVSPTNRQNVVKLSGEAEFTKPETEYGYLIIEEQIDTEEGPKYSTHFVAINFE